MITLDKFSNFISSKKLSKKLGVSKRHLNERISKEIAHVKINKDKKYDPVSVEKYLTKKYRQPVNS